jgi:tetratricopeptide (TPR) repeat protein
MRRLLQFVAAILSVCATWQAYGADFQCPEPAVQVAPNVAADARARTSRIINARDADLAAEVQSTVDNLWARYPQADRIAIAQNLLSTSCNLIKTSSLSDEQKLDRWTKILELFVPSLSPGPTSSPSALALEAENAVSRGDAAAKRADYDLAKAEYNQAIRLNSAYAPAYRGRGEIFIKKRQFELAVNDFSEAIRIDPTSPTYYKLRGEAYYYNKNYDDAISDWSDAIRLDKENAVLFSNRGNAYWAKKDYGGTISDFVEALRLDPKIKGVAEWLQNAREEASLFQFLICNKTGKLVYIALIGKRRSADQHFRAEAWYEVGSGACQGLGKFVKEFGVFCGDVRG